MSFVGNAGSEFSMRENRGLSPVFGFPVFAQVAAVNSVVMHARPERDGMVMLAHQIGGPGQVFEVRGFERRVAVGGGQLSVGRPPLPPGKRRPALNDCIGVCHR